MNIEAALESDSKTIDQRSLPPITSSSIEDTASMRTQKILFKTKAHEMMIPKRGINLMPDENVIKLLKKLHQHKQDCLKNSDFHAAKEAKRKI